MIGRGGREVTRIVANGVSMTTPIKGWSLYNNASAAQYADVTTLKGWGLHICRP